MLRIVEENTANESVTLRLDGRLVNQWIEVLRSSCQQAAQQDGRLILDLAGVNFADHEGVKLLRQLEQQQATFINCSPFLREQLKEPISDKSAFNKWANRRTALRSIKFKQSNRNARPDQIKSGLGRDHYVHPTTTQRI